MNEDTINRHAEAAEREINYTSARNAFAGFGMGLIERSHSRTWIISKHIKAAVNEFLSRQNDAICQTLGKALGFPWYKDDQANFPGATEENGVCVGEHVAESLAELAANEIEKLKRWQREAMSVMAEWDKVWSALGEPGQIGDSIPALCKSEVERREDRIANLEMLCERVIAFAGVQASFGGREDEKSVVRGYESQFKALKGTK